MMSYKTIASFLQKPIVIIGSVILGLGLGFYNKSIGTTLEPVGVAFMALLEMSLIPIIVCAIVLSISSLFSVKTHTKSVGYIIGVLFGFMLAVSAISTLYSLAANPAEDFLNSTSLKVKEISTISSFVDRNIGEPVVKEELKGLSEFVKDSVPRNIFKAFSESQMLQIILFSIIFGVAVAFSQPDYAPRVKNFFETTLELFRSIITTITVFLPIGIVALMAGSASNIGTDMLVQMGGFIIKVYSLFIFLFLLSTLIISKKTGLGFIKVIKAMKDPLVISFGTRSAILPIPSILDAFENKLKLEQSIPKLLVPLGAVLGRFGNIAYFAFLAIFIACIYQQEITPSVFMIITFLTILGGLSTAGATGVLTLVSLTIVMDPLQLPIGAIIPLLIAVDAIVDPMRTLTSVYTNCAAVALVSESKTKTPSQNETFVNSQQTKGVL